MAVSKVDAANQIENQLPQANIANNLPSRNIVINGDMNIAQRGTSTASITSEGYHTVDRFVFYPNSLGTFTMSQDTDVPTGQGFSKSIKLDCTVANASPSASTFIHLQHRIEGQNLQYLKKGTSSAESLTLSFWVKSTKTGTATVEFFDIDNTRSNSQTFTINSASTWEKKTITIDGDTTGAFTNDNGASLYLIWWLGTGSTYNSGTLNTSWNSRVNANIASSSNINLADDTANNFWITGVQLEAGDTASDFEFLPYDVNLQRCYRYFQMIAEGNFKSLCIGAMYASNYLLGVVDFTPKRANPSIYQVTGTNYYGYNRGSANDQYNSVSLAQATLTKVRIQNTTQVSGTQGFAGEMMLNNSNAKFGLDAEL